MASLTVVVPTFDRAERLAAALRALTTQTDPPARREIIVVDNNSTDRTAELVSALGAGVRYLFEPRQGLSFARNAGIESATRFASNPDDEIIAFTDDDVEVAPDWMRKLLDTFEAQEDVHCVGGRVLPRWPQAPPRWITREHWAPLALQDHGPEPRRFDAANPVGLIGASLAFRRSVFDRVGLFSAGLQRVRDSVGSTEDHELLLRLYAAGGRALYDPGLVAWAPVDKRRLTRSYHRRWHAGHGRYHALMRDPQTERTSLGRFLGVPAHLYRSALRDGAGWLRAWVARDRDAAFARETRLRFFWGYLGERNRWAWRR